MDFDFRTFIIFGLTLFEFAFGIVEAVYAAKYYQYRNECVFIWRWILVASIIDISIPILSYCGVKYLIDNENQRLLVEENQNLTINETIKKYCTSLLLLQI